MAKKKFGDDFSEAEAKRRFEQALKGAVKPVKKSKPKKPKKKA